MHGPNPRSVFAAAIVAAILVGPAVHATVVLPADLGDLSRDAIAIARGQVVDVEVRWADDRHSIVTDVTLAVESYLKGGLGPTVQFRVPGGELGRLRSIVVGAPEFAIEERVVVFLGARGPMVPYVLGLSQGVFRVSRAADNSGWFVTPPALLPSAGRTVAVVRGDVNRRPMALADFERTVRALAAGAR